MKKTLLILLVFVFGQSCQTYKAIEIAEIKEGKVYQFHLENGQDVESRCRRINNDSYSIMVNKNLMALPKSGVASVKKKKVSLAWLLGGMAAAVVGTIIILENGDQGSAPNVLN